MITVFTDGGARGNPGPSAIGIYIIDDKNQVLYERGERIGVATNNIAEYKGVLKALFWLSQNNSIVKKHSAIHFLLDSQLVVSQINGIFKVKNPTLHSLLFEIRKKETEISAKIIYSHIARDKNKKADFLVNKALDEV